MILWRFSSSLLLNFLKLQRVFCRLTMLLRQHKIHKILWKSSSPQYCTRIARRKNWNIKMTIMIAIYWLSFYEFSILRTFIISNSTASSGVTRMEKNIIKFSNIINTTLCYKYNTENHHHPFSHLQKTSFFTPKKHNVICKKKTYKIPFDSVTPCLISCALI